MPQSVKTTFDIAEALVEGIPTSVKIQVQMVDGSTIVTALTAIDDVAYAAQAGARLDPADKEDPVIGLKLAMGRAIRKLGQEILRDGRRDVEKADQIVKRQKEAQEAKLVAKKKRSTAAKAAATRKNKVDGKNAKKTVKV